MLRTLTNFTAACLLAYAPAALAQASSQASADASANANASARQSEQEGSLASGTALNAQLDQSVDSKKAKEGDSVTARTTDAVKANGKTILPKGTKLVGHVTRASARSKGDADSMLGVQFDRAILKDGREIPMQVSLQALAAAQGASAVGGDDLQPMGGATGGGGAGASGRGGGMAGGGVGGTVSGAASGAANTVPRAAAGATGAVNSTVGGAANAAGGAATGLGAGGQLTSTSRGVFGLNGLALASSTAGSAEGSVITSTGKNVHLDSGTRMLLVTQAAAATAASAQR